MKNISRLAIDKGHNVNFDGVAVYHTVVKGDTLWGFLGSMGWR